MATDPDNPLLRFVRDDSAPRNLLRVDLQQQGSTAPGSILGNFFENLTFAVVGGISAQLLSNPTFAREAHLRPRQAEQLLTNGEALVGLYLSGGDPAVLRWGWGAEDPAILRRRWWPTPLCTGFGVSVLDDATQQNVPFAWGPLGYPGSINASAGRIGGAVRLL